MMTRCLIFQFSICLLGIISFSSCAQTRQELIPRNYIAYKATDSIIIDGDESDISWNNVKWSDSFIDIQGKNTPKYNTKVKILWDETYFYILAKLEEPHVWATITKHDAIIFHNNDFEVFVDPDGDSHGYYELEINALNTSWDLLVSKPYRELNQPILNDWHITGFKSAVKINGTLNNPNDIDKGWVVEMAIPWAVYKTSYFQDIVPRNAFWRINFSRVNWDFQLTNEGKYQREKDKKGNLLHEYNWVWSPTGVINMHEPEKWGYVYFSSNNAGNDTTFTIPQDEKIKWKLFELYRKQKAYFKKNKKWLTSLDALVDKDIYIADKKIIPIFESHSQGWNLIVKSPFSGQQLIIREDGKLIIN